ncbi:MAG: hypothetical protein H6730_29085 [Deltaproteobacteria bacterium]|nr:hypothetical protein [Deltaproteobacteria bacterium]
MLQGQGAQIMGPCVGAARCPRLEDARDWCHFTFRTRPGPRTRRMFDLARRRWQETHSSWLALGGGQRREGLHRLLELRPRGKAKVEAVFCGAEGLRVVNALERSKACFEVLDRAEVGGLFQLDLGRMEPKGDGLRLVDASGVTPFEVG